MSRLPSRTASVRFDPNHYLAHLVGLTALLAWKARWDASPGAVEMEGPLMVAGLFPSQRFALGFPTRKGAYGRYPFLAIQGDEAPFFRRLRWSRAWVDRDAGRLVLATRKVQGDGETLEDLPAMGLALSVDLPLKLDWLAKSPRLEARPLWFNEDGHHVGGGLPMAQWDVRTRAPGEPLFPEGALSQERSLRDILDSKIEETNRLYSPYQGQAVAVGQDFRDLVAPFRPEAVDLVRPR